MTMTPEQVERVREAKAAFDTAVEESFGINSPLFEALDKLRHAFVTQIAPALAAAGDASGDEWMVEFTTMGRWWIFRNGERQFSFDCHAHAKNTAKRLNRYADLERAARNVVKAAKRYSSTAWADEFNEAVTDLSAALTDEPTP